jgi:hypothetical protein
MPVTNQIPAKVSIANGATSVFPYDFLVLDEADMLVTGTLDGVTTTYVLNVDYTVSGIGDDTGGDVTFISGNPAAGTSVLRRREMDPVRETDYQTNGDLIAVEVNRDNDRPIMLIQQLLEEISRTIKLPAHLTGQDGTLPEPDPLHPLVWNAAGNGIENGDTTLTGDMLLRPNLAAGTDGLFVQSAIGAIVRGFLHKMRDLVHADDFGLLGDGVTDETTQLQRLFNAAQGKTLMLGYNKTYAFDTATGLAILANTTLIANGSKFKRLTARSGAISDADYNITVGNDCNIDKLEVDAVGGASDCGGVLISGSRVRIGRLKVNCGSAGSGSLGNLWNAARIGPNAGSATDIHIGELITSDWDRPYSVQNVDGWSIGFVRVTNYRRGLYIKDSSNGYVAGGKITAVSPNTNGFPGDNGILIEATASHGSTHDIRIRNVTVEDAGEHGFRLGGQFITRNVWHTNCHAKNTGAGLGVYPPNNNGGCGFKAEGPTAVFGARHQNIHYIDCSVEDMNATSIANVAARGGKSNFAGFQLAKIFNGSIVNPIVTKRPADTGTYAETGNSCFNGIEIIGCQKITITNPQIQRPYNSGVYIYDFSDGVNDWGQTDDIEVIGGHVNTPGVAGVEVDCSVITMRRISIQGDLAVNAGQYTMKVAKSGTGAFVNCFASMRSLSPTVESFNGLGTDWTIRGQGTEVGASACANGSTFQSATAATLRVRKAGAWASL